MNTIREMPSNSDLTASSNSNATNGNGINQHPATASSLPPNNGSSSPIEYDADLKIIGHIKNIEKINEQRRVFLANSISEYSTDEKIETKITEINGKSVNGNSDERNGVVHTYNEEQRMHIREELVESLDSSQPKYSAPLKSPTTPPPKPPMLSRTLSGRGSSMGSQSPAAAAYMPATQTSVEHVSNGFMPPVITQVPVTSATIPEPVKITTVQLKDEDIPVMRRVERAAATSSPDQPKQVSANHYERLIEELKCPGCAYPMKAPILLCKTGHSICEQCTRVLMLCPLCKEPFTNLRSRTVEALCSKAHFRCANASGGCTVRLQIDLLGWHEKQCIYKPMKCFMGRVWGDCQWSGREAHWKEHLESEHANKVFGTDNIDLIWNMGVKQRPLTGYYVFEIFDEMFNFYEVYDKERVLFTMTNTSTIKEKKHNYAFEVTMINQENEALAITQKFPVHSEYDSDILLDGTCVSIPLNDLVKFIDEDRLLHYRVRVLEVKSPRKSKYSRHSSPPNGIHPIDFQQTQIEGCNLKNVPSDVIVTRKLDDIPYVDSSGSGPSGLGSSSEEEVEKIARQYNRKIADDSGSESDPEFEAFIAKKWGTPQLHFNRKYLKTNSSDSSSNSDAASQRKNGHDILGKMDKKFQADDKISVCSTNTSYKKRMTNSLRKSFRSLKSDIIEMKPFAKKSPEKKKSPPPPPLQPAAAAAE